MRFALLLEQSEWRAELSVQRVSAVSHHWQAAAVFRAIFRKGGDDDVATGFDAVQNGANVSLSFCCRRQKVEHGAVIRNVCRRFVMLCRELKLFTEAVVAIDGSKFKAVNNRERNFTPGKIERRERELEESIQRYLDALETADRTQPAEMQAKTDRLHGKIQKMRQRLQGLQVIKAQLETVPDRQISQTDPDARAMTTYSAKGTAMVGYNVQAAVDTKNHLIVAHEVTNNGNDRAQLSPMVLTIIQN